MKQRYKVGFENGNKCYWTEQNPELIPIVERGFIAVAFCLDKETANMIAQALNNAERSRLMWEEISNAS